MRAIWKGSISFGLVNIPVHLYTASREKEISFVLLHKKDMSEVRYARICKEEEKEIPWSEIVKAYEYEAGNYVILDDADFEKVNQKKTKTIEIINFIAEEEIDTVYYVKPYYLEPEAHAVNAYILLREALKQSKKVGLARYVMRNREHLAVIKVHDDAIILNELRYQSELLRVQDLKIPKKVKYVQKELDIAVLLIDQLTVPFKPQAYKDTYTEELKDLIKKKSKGKPIHPKSSSAPQPAKVHDIMSLLQASLEPPKKRTKKGKKLG